MLAIDSVPNYLLNEEWPEGVREVRHEEVFRITTVPEMQHFLRAAGFETIRVLPHHEEDDESEDNPENLWFVAINGT